MHSLDTLLCGVVITVGLVKAFINFEILQEDNINFFSDPLVNTLFSYTYTLNKPVFTE